MSLQLASSVGRTCTLVKYNGQYGRIKSASSKSASGGICKCSLTGWFPQPERKRDRENYQECSVHTIHTGGSSFRRKGHISHERDDNKVMQREIDDLKKQLRRVQHKRSPSSSDVSSNDEEDTMYRQRSRTPPSESFSYDEERHHWRKYRSPSRKGVGTDVMKKALNQISKSPFTRGIEKAKLPRRFHQPTFAMYNGQTDPVEHVS